MAGASVVVLDRADTGGATDAGAGILSPATVAVRRSGAGRPRRGRTWPRCSGGRSGRRRRRSATRRSSGRGSGSGRPPRVDRPLLGALPVGNVTVCTGHGAEGLLLGPYCARVVAQQLLGAHPDPDLEPFRPDRSTPSSVRPVASDHIAWVDAVDGPRRAGALRERMGLPRARRRRDPRRRAVRAPRRPHAEPRRGNGRARPRAGRAPAVAAPVHHRHVGVGDPGRTDRPGRDARAAAARETLEETGWRPGPFRPLVRFQPTNGISDQVFNIFLADGATQVGDPVDPRRPIGSNGYRSRASGSWSGTGR